MEFLRCNCETVTPAEQWVEIDVGDVGRHLLRSSQVKLWLAAQDM
jgi:hypothetical protein